MNKHQYTGFTLLELLIAVTIIGIIATFAFPSYQESLNKSHRASAKSMMLQVANLEERYFTENNQYGALADLGKADPLPAEGGQHNITVSHTDTTYLITATPVNTDATCGNLTLSNTGVQGSSVAGSSCW